MYLVLEVDDYMPHHFKEQSENMNESQLYASVRLYSHLSSITVWRKLHCTPNSSRGITTYKVLVVILINENFPSATASVVRIRNPVMRHTITKISTAYRTAGNFRGVQIFAVFADRPATTKINPFGHKSL